MQCENFKDVSWEILLQIEILWQKSGGFFAQFSGNAKQGFVRDFELDHFLSQLDGKKSELGNFYLIFQQFFNKIMAILFENLS